MKSRCETGRPAAGPVIRCDHVTVAYGRQEVIHDASFEIQAGTLLPFIGPNGAGKTTLLRAILGLVPVAVGTVRTPFARKPAGYVPQNKAIDPLYPVTARKIVEMGLYPELGFWKQPSKEHRQRVDEVLRRFGLTAHQDKTFDELSGGMKQKTLLGRALVSGADVFVMDEPTSELDEDSGKNVLNQLVRLVQDEGKTVLLAQHGLDRAALLAGLFCVVYQGRVRIAGFSEAKKILTEGSGGEGASHD